MAVRSRIARLERMAGRRDAELCGCGPGGGFDIYWPGRPPPPWREGLPREPFDPAASAEDYLALEPRRCPDCGRWRRLCIVRWKERELPRRAS